MNSLLLAVALASFLHADDRWVFLGDSITDNGTYRSLIERVITHYHPDAKLTFTKLGVSGATSSVNVNSPDQKPTVVSIMFGMNNSINSSWRPGDPLAPALAGYRADILAKTRSFKEQGAAVILMSPTLTDESYSGGIYELAGTREFLKGCAQIVKEIAAQEGVTYLPVQEEFEAYQQTLHPLQILRADGVHPSALGQYQIGRTFWENLHFAGPLSKGDRPLAKLAQPVPVTVQLASRFLTSNLTFRVKAKQPLTVNATWSLGTERKTEKLQLTGQEDTWTPAIPATALAMTNGTSTQLVFDLQAGEQRSLYVVDLSRTRVIHLKDGKAAGENWQVATTGKGLLFSGEVTSAFKHSDDFWPWARDGVCVWLDARPADRFGDINVDADVHQTLLLVRDQPFFGLTMLPWLGTGMPHAADAGAERTPTGYRWHLYVHRYFAKARPVDFTKADFVGFNVIVVENGNATAAFSPAQPHDKYGNTFMVLDLKNQIPGDWITHAHLFGR